jgi:hypothetical protein
MRSLFSILLAVTGLTLIAAWYFGRYVANPYVGDAGLFATNAAHDVLHLGIGGVLLLLGVLGRPLAGFVFGLFVFTTLALAGALTHGNMIFEIIHVNDLSRLVHLAGAVAFVFLVAVAMRLIPQDQRA